MCNRLQFSHAVGEVVVHTGHNNGGGYVGIESESGASER